MKYNSQALTNIADKLLQGKNRFERLKEIANKQNYHHKVQKLKERLLSELKFWMAKGPSNRLDDIHRDIKHLSNLLDNKEFTAQEKIKVDELVSKYPIS